MNGGSNPNVSFSTFKTLNSLQGTQPGKGKSLFQHRICGNYTCRKIQKNLTLRNKEGGGILITNGVIVPWSDQHLLNSTVYSHPDVPHTCSVWFNEHGQMCPTDKKMRQNKPLKDSIFLKKSCLSCPCREQKNQKNAPDMCFIMFPVHLGSEIRLKRMETQLHHALV